MWDGQMETVSLTYPEAATRLGIAIASVRRIATRLRWERVRGNDGTWRVMVPADRLSCLPTRRPTTDNISADMSTDTPTDNTNVSADTGTDARALIDYLASRVTELEGEVKTLRPLAAELAAATAKADAAERRAEELVDAERRRADDLKAALDRATASRGLFARWRRAG